MIHREGVAGHEQLGREDVCVDFLKALSFQIQFPLQEIGTVVRQDDVAEFVCNAESLVLQGEGVVDYNKSLLGAGKKRTQYAPNE